MFCYSVPWFNGYCVFLCFVTYTDIHRHNLAYCDIVVGITCDMILVSLIFHWLLTCYYFVFKKLCICDKIIIINYHY